MPTVSFWRLALVLAACSWSARASAEELHDAASIERVCKAERDSSLCREVRRLCAAREVRESFVPACKALGVWGDTPLVEVRELCTLEPDHPRCTEIKAACAADGGRRLGKDGPEACAAAGWGPLTMPTGPETETQPEEQITPEQAEQVIDYCKDHGSDSRCLELRGACAQLSPAADPMVTHVCQALGLPMAGTAGGSGPAQPPGKTVQAIISRESRPLATGFMGIGFTTGESEVMGGGDWALSFDAESVSFGADWALGGAMQLQLGGTSDGGFIYRFDAMAGLAVMHGKLGVSLTGGAGISGVADGRMPLALEIPARAAAQLIISDRITVMGWVQADWLVAGAGADAREDGSISFPFADAAQAGLFFFVDVGWRARGQSVPRLVLGAVGVEAVDHRALLFTLGIGTAQEAPGLAGPR